MKRNEPFESDQPSKRILSDVTTATNNQTVHPNNSQHISNGDNRHPTESRTMQSSTASSFPYVPYNNSEFYNMDANNSNMMNPYPRMWQHPNTMYSYGLSVPNVNSYNTANGEASGVNTSDRPNEAAIRSPSPVVEFSKHNLDDVINKLEDNHSFRDGIQILQKWLNSGVCNKDNFEEFFTLINNSHKQVWRIMMEKTSVKDNMNKEKKEVSKGTKDIAAQYAEQMRIVDYCKKQKVWDQFSKGQRKQLSNLFEEILKLKSVLGSVLSDTEEEEDGAKSPDSSTDCDEAELIQYQKFCEDNDNIKHEIEALQEDSRSVKLEEQDSLIKNKLVVGEHSKNITELLNKGKELKVYKESANAVSEPQTIPQAVPPVQHSNLDVSLDEFRLLALIAVFLSVHPPGASLDYMSSYAMALNKRASLARPLESLLRKYPDLFQEKTIGIGFNLQKIWMFAGFNYLKH